MRGAISFILCACIVSAFGYALKDECHVDGDCPATHCCVHDYRGQYCHEYQNATQTCHLPGHTLHLYHCNCAPGFHCEPFHLSSASDLTGALHQVEQVLTHTGFGTCQKGVGGIIV